MGRRGQRGALRVGAAVKKGVWPHKPTPTCKRRVTPAVSRSVTLRSASVALHVASPSTPCLCPVKPASNCMSRGHLPPAVSRSVTLQHSSRSSSPPKATLGGPTHLHKPCGTSGQQVGDLAVRLCEARLAHDGEAQPCLLTQLGLKHAALGGVTQGLMRGWEGWKQVLNTGDTEARLRLCVSDLRVRVSQRHAKGAAQHSGA